MSPNFSFLLKYAKHYPLKIFLTIVLGFSGAIFNGVSTTLIVPVVLTFLGQDLELVTGAPIIKALLAPFENIPETYRLGVMAGAIIFAVALKNLTTYIGRLVSGSLQRSLVSDLRKDGVKLLLDVDMDYYSKTRIGDILNQLSGETGRTSSAVSILIQILTVSITIFVYFIILISISWELTLASSLVVGIVVLSNQVLIRRAKVLGGKVTEVTRAYSIGTLEALGGIRLVKTKLK
ncbi:MAG: ABC transporter transmembrane domain-containing protein, partial [Cyanobacteriota bacterium]|nr:ABC transporter transmembrane domain-containing protein [Cyanobacteriota bacterium]